MRGGFVPPPYPYDRLERAIGLASAHGTVVDLSIGVPCDPPPAAVLAALADAGAARSYPLSMGSAELRSAAGEWMRRRLGVGDPGMISACVGTKEFVATTPQLLSLRTPGLDTVLYPAISYPTYAMGATLAGCRPVPVALDAAGRLDLASVSQEDAERSLCLWVNSPSNPTGAVDDLGVIAGWGRDRGIPVLSDECYVEFTWDGPPESILAGGTSGVVAVHSLSKRSNFAGGRVGFFAGDDELVGFLAEVRKHMGLMPPGPSQAAATVALNDDEHVDRQRDRYRSRLDRLRAILHSCGLDSDLPQGAFYLWVEAPDGDAWALTEQLASRLGMVVSPGEFYGPAGASRVRVAAVQPGEYLDLLESRVA